MHWLLVDVLVRRVDNHPKKQQEVLLAGFRKMVNLDIKLHLAIPYPSRTKSDPPYCRTNFLYRIPCQDVTAHNDGRPAPSPLEQFPWLCVGGRELVISVRGVGLHPAPKPADPGSTSNNPPRMHSRLYTLVLISICHRIVPYYLSKFNPRHWWLIRGKW